MKAVVVEHLIKCHIDLVSAETNPLLLVQAEKLKSGKKKRLVRGSPIRVLKFDDHRASRIVSSSGSPKLSLRGVQGVFCL